MSMYIYMHTTSTYLFYIFVFRIFVYSLVTSIHNTFIYIYRPTQTPTPIPYPDAATNVLATVNNSNLTEEAKQKQLDVQDIVATSLEGAWVNEVIITVRNGVEIRGEIINATKGDERIVVGNFVDFPPPTSNELLKCVVGQGDNDETAVDLFHVLLVLSKTMIVVSFLISMNIPEIEIINNRSIK